MCECDGYTCNRHDESNVSRLERELAEAKEHVRQWERVGDKMDRGIKKIETDLKEAKERERQLRKQLDDAKDDLCRLDGACWYCLSPDVEYAWRHEHPPQGPHWHHRLDPGDGLVSDCEHSEMYERVFQEGREAGLAEAHAARPRNV